MQPQTRPTGRTVHVLHTTGPLSFDSLVRGLYCPSSLGPFDTGRGAPAPGSAEAQLVHKLETGLMLHSGQLIELEAYLQPMVTGLRQAPPPHRPMWVEARKRVREARGAGGSARARLVDEISDACNGIDGKTARLAALDGCTHTMADMINTAEKTILVSHSLFECAYGLAHHDRLSDPVITTTGKIQLARESDVAQARAHNRPERFRAELARLGEMGRVAKAMLDRDEWEHDEYERHARQMLVVLGAADRMGEMVQAR